MWQMYEESKNETFLEKHMFELADYYISLHKPNNTDYQKKYGELLMKFVIIIEKGEAVNIKKENLPIEPVIPGELLNEVFLLPLGISKYRLAKEIGVPAVADW